MRQAKSTMSDLAKFESANLSTNVKTQSVHEVNYLHLMAARMQEHMHAAHT